MSNSTTGDIDEGALLSRSNVAVLSEILSSPDLAAVYLQFHRRGPTSVPDIIDAVPTAKSTTYEYVDRLAEAGLLTPADTDARPTPYVAHSATLSVSIDGERETLELSPALLEAIVAQRDDEHVGRFVDRHGIPMLAAALDLAHEYVDGTVNHRIAARDLDVSPLEAEEILQALAPIVADDLPDSRHVTPSLEPEPSQDDA